MREAPPAQDLEAHLLPLFICTPTSSLVIKDHADMITNPCALCKALHPDTGSECAGSMFMRPGFQSNISLRNDIFGNRNIQWYPGIQSNHISEPDPGWLPIGFVNANPDGPRAAFLDAVIPP